MKSLCWSAVSLLSIAAIPANAAEWGFVPSMMSNVDYTDNPRLIPGSDEAHSGARAEVSAQLGLATEATSLSLVPRFVYAQYEDDPLLDRKDVYLTASAQRAYERVSWTASTSFARDTTLTSELGLTGLQYANRDRENLSLSLGPMWQVSERAQVSAQYYGADTHYKDAEFTGLVDYSYWLVALSGTYVWTEKLTLGFESSAGTLDVPDTRRVDRDMNASLSLDWQVVEGWSARFSYGPTRIETDAGDMQGQIYSASISRESLRSNQLLAVERDVTPTGRGIFVTREHARLSNSYAVTPRMSWSVTAQATRTTDAIIGSDYTNQYLNASTSLRWRFAQHWSAVLSASASQQKYEQRDNAEGFSASIGLVWDGRKHALSR